MNHKTKIFRGTCAEVELQMNQWFGEIVVIIKHTMQTEQSMNTITVTIIYFDATSK